MLFGKVAPTNTNWVPGKESTVTLQGQLGSRTYAMIYFSNILLPEWEFITQDKMGIVKINLGLNDRSMTITPNLFPTFCWSDWKGRLGNQVSCH